MKKWMLLLLIFVMLICCSCGQPDLQETVPPTETEAEAEEFCVRFEVQGNVFSRQNLTADEFPKEFDVYLVGGELNYWTDSNGEYVDPFTTCVDEDVTYSAVIRPVLSKHVPYLFVNSEGLICPDLPLTEQDLSLALNTLATEEAMAYFPQLSSGDNAIAWGDLADQLCYFFDEELVLGAFPQSQSISRGDFARGMNQLLGRGEDEYFEIANGYTIPSDMTMDRQNAEALLEAVIEHTPAEEGTTWSQIELPFVYEPGFVNVDGWLYYVKEDGYLLKDEYIGTLYFGPNGRYTTSDLELDQVVADILKEIIAENPEAAPLELLRVIFDHCHQNYTYRRIYKGNPEYNTNGWEIELAKSMFETGKGNCYSYAAIFWALSRGVGYETRAISGKCLADRQPHSWCIIELDGEDYIFDPEWQYNYTERKIFHYDMFMISMERAKFWKYKWEK